MSTLEIVDFILRYNMLIRKGKILSKVFYSDIIKKNGVVYEKFLSDCEKLFKETIEILFKNDELYSLFDALFYVYDKIKYSLKNIEYFY